MYHISGHTARIKNVPRCSPGDKKCLLTRDALGAHVILQVVARAQVADDDAACAGAAVDELAVADVDTDVADAGAVARKEHQVAELEVGLLDIGAVVVVDAAGLGLEGTFSPVIYDVNGRAIYGMRNIDKDFAISKGMVEYYNDLQTATVNSRAGANPLVVKAVSVRGGANSVNPVNVVVSVEDGDKILYANEKSGMLENKAVAFVK